MSLPQQNYDEAVKSAQLTLKRLAEHDRNPVVFKESSTNGLRSIAWDLEAIGAAIRMELNDRSDRPMDLA